MNKFEAILLISPDVSKSILDDNLKNKLISKIRNDLSPKHVPSKIYSVNEIPKTRSGKIVEILIRKLINGEKFSNTETLVNPDCLKEYQEIYKKLQNHA